MVMWAIGTLAAGTALSSRSWCLMSRGAGAVLLAIGASLAFTGPACVSRQKRLQF